MIKILLLLLSLLPSLSFSAEKSPVIDFSVHIQLKPENGIAALKWIRCDFSDCSLTSLNHPYEVGAAILDKKAADVLWFRLRAVNKGNVSSGVGIPEFRITSGKHKDCYHRMRRDIETSKKEGSLSLNIYAPRAGFDSDIKRRLAELEENDSCELYIPIVEVNDRAGESRRAIITIPKCKSFITSEGSMDDLTKIKWIEVLNKHSNSRCQ